MSLKSLQEDYLRFLGKDGARLVTGAERATYMANELDVYALEKGLRRPCRYLLSPFFEDCGMVSERRDGFGPVVVGVMSRSIHAAEDTNDFKAEASVALAISPYNEFGAEVMRTEHGFLVLISPVTFSFCFLYAILAVTSAQATGLFYQGLAARGPDDVPLIDPFEWVYASHRALMSTVQEFLKSGSVADPLGRVKEARFDLLPWHYIYRVQATYEQMLDFLALHELGHISLGHMGQMELVRRVVPSTSISYEVSSPMPAQEEAADKFSLNCLVGRGHAEELLALFHLIEEEGVQSDKLDKLWTGKTSLGRYTSALQLLKLFDIFDSGQCRKNAGFEFTDACEINGTHPSGQHRFIKGWANNHVLELQAPHQFNIGPIIQWSNWINFDASTHTQEQVRAICQQLDIL
ncbi:hypothetical protein DAH51_06265 [Sphingobium yanoikuyae]|jgi:hypothetical protein|uniref:Uncharacterized protein n=2 Tax=Sphingobium yanoikuyae TaxID=13690 RepID=A0A430C4M0_SPHYA|nr:hypothetical protein DAH51_06265 [Sphingobium yanoikuyae]